MKIYYQIPDQLGEVEDHINELVNNSPPELMSIVNSFSGMIIKFYNEKNINYYEMMKFKLMWALRFLEEEIEKENGSFLITKDGGLEMNDFSSTLCDKIADEIKERFKK